MRSHRWALTELRRELVGDTRSAWAAVHRAAPPPNLPDVRPLLPLPGAAARQLRRRRAPRPGSVWAVTMVRDEADIIAHTIDHLLGQGVEHVLVADNLSSDGTSELLARLAREMPVTVLRDTLAAMHQAEKTTRLARLATAAGAQWIVPFDADELWCATDGTLAQSLARTPHSVLAAPMYDHVPSDDDDPSEPNPFLRVRNRLVHPKAMTKTAFRAHPLAFIERGAHSVRHPTGRAMPSELFIRHIPYRTTEQVQRKVRQGAAASRLAEPDGNHSVHWRSLADGRPEAVVQYYRREGHAMVNDPAPFTPRRTAP